MTERTGDEIIADALDRLKANDTLSQIRILAERVGQIASDTAVHAERDSAMSDKFDKMEARFDKMERKFDDLDTKVDTVARHVESMDNKWKGGVAVVMLIGTLVGVVAGFWDRISKIFGHG